MCVGKKIITMVGMAIVLSAVFLTVLPAIATDHSAQRVGKTASEGDYVLGIYGNANLDDTIDMRDFTYTARIILWLEDETDFADANYDGEVNVLDMTQIGLIILGRESELTIMDAEGAAKTISKPVEEIIVLNPDCSEAIRAIGANERIIGIESATAGYTTFFPELSQLPSVGSGSMPDIEEIMGMDPDILIAYAPGVYNPGHEGLEDKLEPEVTVVRLDFYKIGTIRDEMLKLGYLLDEEENAREYVDWYDGYVDEIADRVSGISEDEKPKVYIDYGGGEGSSERLTSAKGTGNHQLCERAGGINIAADLPPGLAPGYPYVSLEWILAQNPAVIIGQASGYNTREGGYRTDDDSKLKAYYDELIGLSGFAELPAVENNRTYIIQSDVNGGLAGIVGLAYHATWFHPELFCELDPQEIHQEYIDEFCDIDFDVREQGVFVYYQ
jgi:iron complex transport system substrate-binding protein